MHSWSEYKFELYKHEQMIRGVAPDGHIVVFAISGTPCDPNLIDRFGNVDSDEADTADLAWRIAHCLRVCQGLTIEQLTSMKDGQKANDK